jgi:glyoxylase-like metal-dependent hydrolase (beta-lactamase superfamily II)
MAQAPAEVTLTRIDCGTGATPTDVGQRFTDTFAYKDLQLTFTFSCYLIKHGNEYMVWDTGFAPGTSPNAPKVGIVDRLKELKITPEQVKYVGISFKTWIGEGRKVEPLTGDKDVFGDGSVIVLRMPGHTLGHSCLLVRLKDMGPVLLTGDLVHFRENYETGGVPSFNVDRAATVASIERMKQIVANLKATVIIQHDMRDIGKLPAFPAAAK